ncbi:uncharacterized protein BDW70DRAFT_146197 [Aspergillus foveolatus]|uniref:uncharacterized protein n=1 Tax=Aspergillus foveolatus TaxID=210207 RepID=UPI003CCE1D2A
MSVLKYLPSSYPQYCMPVSYSQYVPIIPPVCSSYRGYDPSPLRALVSYCQYGGPGRLSSDIVTR